MNNKQQQSPFPRYVAIHEAGHAVVGLILMPRVTVEVGLVRRHGLTDGFCDFAPTSKLPSYRRQAVICYAGPIAQGIYKRCGLNKTGAKGDFEAAMKYYRQAVEKWPSLIRHKGYRHMWLSEAEQRARELVKENWPWINRVADALQVSGRLTGKQIKQLGSQTKR